MSEQMAFDVAPTPPPTDRDAILAAVEEVLRREAELAQPAAWRVAGRTQRVGISDLTRSVPAHRRWSLSARFPRGGRPFTGLVGRGDAK